MRRVTTIISALLLCAATITPLHAADIIDMTELLRSSTTVEKMLQNKVSKTDNFTVDAFILKVYATAATSVEITKGLNTLNKAVSSDPIALNALPSRSELEKLKDDVADQAENVASVAKMSVDALGAAKREKSFARKAKLATAVSSTSNMNKRIVSESKMQVEIMQSLVKHISDMKLPLK